MKKQTNNLNVEVEGGELALENNFGDIVIIPKNKRQWVEMKLQEGCHNCIDNLVATLPTATDYAQDGLTVPENKIDPYSWVNTPKDGGFIPAIEKTAEAPMWLKMQRRYDERNNLQGEPSEEYLNKRNVFLGTNLVDYYTNQYVSENNKKPGRVDLLNQLSDKEYEFVSSLPQYQTPFWQETLDKIKFYSDPKKRRKIERILNSDKYSNKEKKDLLNMYKDDPIMDKLSVTNPEVEKLFGSIDQIENIDNIISEYYKEALSRKSRKKLRAFKKEYGIDLEPLYENARKTFEEGKFNLTLDPQELMDGNLGYATYGNLSEEDMGYIFSQSKKKDVEIYFSKPQHYLNYLISNNKLDSDPSFVKAFDETVRKKQKVVMLNDADYIESVGSRVPYIMWHELAHNVNQNYMDVNKKYVKDIRAAINTEGEWNEYLSTPTEFWSFFSTNLRQILKEKSLINDYNDTITEEMLNDPELNKNVRYKYDLKPAIKDSKKLLELVNKLIVQNDDNEKLPDSKYYAEKGLVVPDKNNPTEPTYDAGMIPEMEVKAEAPSWLKYKRDYEAQNPYTAQDLQADVDNRFANPVGREAIDKIDPESYRQDIKRNFMLKRDKEVTDYVRTNLVAEKEQEFYDKNGRKPSRPELMNMLTDKEHDIVYSDPKYQPSLWDDTLRGLQSLTELRKKRRMTNILKSDKYSDREKQQMIDMYKDDPVMAPLAAAAAVNANKENK